MAIDLKKIKKVIDAKNNQPAKKLTPERTLQVADSLEDNNLKPEDVDRYRKLAFDKMTQAEKDKYHIARGIKVKENLRNELNDLFNDMQKKHPGTVVNGIKQRTTDKK
jgi:hypothetical protein